MGRITFIIVNYNDHQNTCCLLKTVMNYDIVSNIIVVDNASTDKSVEILKEIVNNKVTVIESDVNLGYAKGNNLGMRYAAKEFNVDYFAIANPDIQVDSNVLERMVEKMDTIETPTGLMTACMLSPKNYAGCGVWKQPTWRMEICNNLILLKKIIGDRTYYKDFELYGKMCEVDVIAGSFFICKAKTMLDIDYFDEATFLYGEENILAMKLKMMGYTNYLCTDLSYKHEHSASIDKNIDRLQKKFMWLHDSMVYYNRQYLHTNALQNILYDISFYVGLYVYLALKKMLRK